MAKKNKEDKNYLSEWSEAIMRMGAENDKRREERLKALKKQTKELDPASMDSPTLLDTFILANNGGTWPGEREVYEKAAKKLRKELLRRLGNEL